MKKKTNIRISNTKYIKYPFSGLGSNLIDKFLVLSYDQKTIEQTFKSKEVYVINVKNINLKYIKFTELPTITNELCFSYTKETQDNDLLLELVFPKYPRLIFLEKEYIKDQQEQLNWVEMSKNYSIIFSINILDNTNYRKSFNGLGYIFYVKKEHRDKNNEIDRIIFYPITYVILSEFPYFYHFYKICKNINIQMKKETDEIPIDIILYNAIKFCPSPINSSLNLSFGAQLVSNIKKEISANDILNQLNSKNHSEKINGIPSIFFNQLSGYPIMDINLSFIFNLLDPKTILKTFILTFLECDMIFVSSNPEILNTIIYIFANLNYPFNEQIYYWHVLSISENDFLNNFDSPFIGKSSSSLYGICHSNSKNFDFTSRIKDYFLLNIDEKSLSMQNNPNDPNNDTNQLLLDLDEYIEECFPEIDSKTVNSKDNSNIEMDNKNKINNFNDGINLYESIQNIASILNRRFRTVTNSNYIGDKKLLKFFSSYESESEMDVIKENLQIQKAFYNFIVQILSSYMSELEVDIIDKDDNKSYQNDDEYIPLQINLKNNKNEKFDDTPESEIPLAHKAGLAFKQLFQLTSKYSSFLKNFCQHHDCFEISKIPFSFIHEFLYFSKIFPNHNLNSVDIFRLIDEFYGKTKKLDFFEKLKEKQGEEDNLNLYNSIATEKKIENADNFNNIFNFSYNNFENYYKEHLRSFINREQEDDKIIFHKKSWQTKQFKTYLRNDFYLSQKILNIYINYVNNNFEALQKCFNLTKCEYISSEKPKNIIIDKNKINNKDNIFEDFIIIESQETPSKDKSNKENNKREEYEKSFGNYELMEITELIEKHLIKEKYFSSYEMIKYSLLSIIAITSTMENKKINIVEVIKILCDFCTITNSLVRKYMNIFLNIFATMKINNCLDVETCEECIKIIALYFKQTNTFPNEDTIKSIKKSEVKNFNTSISVGFKTLNKFRTTNKSIREKRAEFYQKPEKIETIIDIVETVFTGCYYISKNDLIKPIANISKKFDKLYNELGKHKKEFVQFIPKTPLQLYASSNKILFNFLYGFSLEKKEYIELGTIILSLLFYFKMEFLIPRWSFKVDNIKGVKYSGFDYQSQEKETIKLLVTNIIYILLDLYEAVIETLKK